MVAANILLNVGGNVLATLPNVLVQVRRGALTLQDYGALVSHARRLVSITKGNMAFIAIIEPEAESPAAEVRARQKEFIGQMVERIDVRMGVVILGNDIGATMRRTMARVLVPGHGRLRVVATIPEACGFVASHVGLTARALEELTNEAREAARRTG